MISPGHQMWPFASKYIATDPRGDMASLTSIEGITAAAQKKLKGAGVGSSEALLERGATKKGRKELSENAKIAETKILEWVNRADLMRIKGVSSQYSDLLEAAGVDTVKELKRRNAANLATAMEAANTKGRKQLVKRTPSAKVVQGWVDAAKGLPAVVKY